MTEETPAFVPCGKAALTSGHASSIYCEIKREQPSSLLSQYYNNRTKSDKKVHLRFALNFLKLGQNIKKISSTLTETLKIGFLNPPVNIV